METDWSEPVDSQPQAVKRLAALCVILAKSNTIIGKKYGQYIQAPDVPNTILSDIKRSVPNDLENMQLTIEQIIAESEGCETMDDLSDMVLRRLND